MSDAGLDSEDVKVIEILSLSFVEGWQSQQVKVSPYYQPQTHSPNHLFAGSIHSALYVISSALTELPLKK